MFWSYYHPLNYISFIINFQKKNNGKIPLYFLERYTKRQFKTTLCKKLALLINFSVIFLLKFILVLKIIRVGTIFLRGLMQTIRNCSKM